MTSHFQGTRCRLPSRRSCSFTSRVNLVYSQNTPIVTRASILRALICVSIENTRAERGITREIPRKARKYQ